MAQVYSDPTREDNPIALPDVEVFHMSYLDFLQSDSNTWMHERLLDSVEYVGNNLQAAHDLSGWYWWSCFLGCLPDSDPYGPFDTEAQAIESAQDIE